MLDTDLSTDLSADLSSDLGSQTPSAVLSGLRFILDPSNVVLSGSKIDTFLGPNAVQQSTDANRALYTASDPNFAGRPSAGFGLDRFYSLGDLSSWTQGEMFVAMRLPAYASYGAWTMSTFGSDVHYPFTGDVYESFGIADRPQTFTLTPYAGAGQPHVYNVHAADGAMANGVGGAELFSGSGYTMAFSAAAYFGRSITGTPGNPIYFLHADVAYAAICDREQTAQQRAWMVDYLTQRYGIA